MPTRTTANNVLIHDTTDLQLTYTYMPKRDRAAVTHAAGARCEHVADKAR